MHLELLENRILLAGDGIIDDDYELEPGEISDSKATSIPYLVSDHTIEHLHHPLSLGRIVTLMTAGGFLTYMNTNSGTTALLGAAAIATADLGVHTYCCEADTMTLYKVTTPLALSSASGYTFYKRGYSNPIIASSAAIGGLVGIASHACCFLMDHHNHDDML